MVAVLSQPEEAGDDLGSTNQVENWPVYQRFAKPAKFRPTFWSHTSMGFGGRIPEALRLRVGNGPLNLCLSRILGAVEHRIVHPRIDGGFAPTGAARGNANLLGKRAGLDLPVERRAAEAGAIEHGVEAKNAVGRIGRHGIVLYRVSSNRSPSIQLRRQIRWRKSAKTVSS